MNTFKLAGLIAISFMLLGCNQTEENKKSNTIKPISAAAEMSSSLPQGHPDIAADPQKIVAPMLKTKRGTVKEVINAAGYTYALVDNEGQHIWVAGPETAIEVGQIVAWRRDMPMANFTSPTLNRTFEIIYFISKFQSPDSVKSNINEGIVSESFVSGGYVYLKVKANQTELWLAAPETEIQNGVSISWNGGAVMHNFKSTTLDRVFDEITFVDSFIVKS